MKYLVMIDRFPGEEYPPQATEEVVYRTITEKGMDMPPVRAGWKKDGNVFVQISSEAFPGAKSIWFWEVS